MHVVESIDGHKDRGTMTRSFGPTQTRHDTTGVGPMPARPDSWAMSRPMPWHGGLALHGMIKEK